MTQTISAVSPQQRVVAWLRAIGIAVEMTDEPVESFITGVAIVDGALLVNHSASVSGILHEAGHLAIMPAEVRELVTGDTEAAIGEILDAADLTDMDPDAPFMRAVIQCSDPEATAWAWAAGRACGLPAADIIADDEYAGQGAEIRGALSLGAYIGINGLRAAGMTDMKAFPTMKRWLQPNFGVNLQPELSPG